ncbi:MAG: SPW repeat protein [Alphaproteobacteria bacterium]|nr:SPW repeat protein [Alphaproteobacteria bacterium]
MATLPMRNVTRLARENRWLDWFLVALSVWFFISPWVISFGGGVVPHNTVVPPHEEAAILVMTSRAAWNAWVCGAILFFVMLSAVGRLEASQEWIALILGAWLIAAPWALGFTPLGGASADHWAVGIVVFLIAAWNLWRMRNVLPPANTVVPPTSRPPRQPLV